jgi:cell division septation protein DedD
MDKFRAEVKALLNGEAKQEETKEPESKKLYRVQVGAFENVKNAEALASELRSKGYKTIIKEG